MNLRKIGAVALAAAGLAALTLPAAAGQRHWFYGNYGAYDRGAVVDFGFWAGPRPAPPPLPPQYQAAYPPVYAGPRTAAPEFYYEVAPGSYVPVYANDGRNRPVVTDEYGNPLPYRPAPRARQARPRQGLSYVPKPKPKPEVPQQVAATDPNATVVETDHPVKKPDVPQEVATTDPKATIVETDHPVKNATEKMISCDKAREIVGGFGFTDIQTVGCAGKEYGFRARRDGKDFDVRLSSFSGELISVKHR